MNVCYTARCAGQNHGHRFGTIFICAITFYYLKIFKLCKCILLPIIHTIETLHHKRGKSILNFLQVPISGDVDAQGYNLSRACVFIEDAFRLF